MKFEFRWAASFAALLFVFSLGGIACDEEIREKCAYLSKLEGKIASAEEENDKIRLAVAELSSPQNLERIAETELGMVRAVEGNRFFFAEEETSSFDEKEEFEGGGIFGALGRLWEQ